MDNVDIITLSKFNVINGDRHKFNNIIEKKVIKWINERKKPWNKNVVDKKYMYHHWEERLLLLLTQQDICFIR